MKTSLPEHSCSTETLHPAKDSLSPAQKLYGRPIQATLPAHRRSFSSEWLAGTKEAELKAADSKEKAETYYNKRAHPLPEIHIGSKVAIQNPETKLWDIYGTIADIGPFRHYYVKTAGGRVLVRNHRFLRRRIPASIPSTTQTPQQPQPPQPRSPPRCSSRQSKTPG